MEDPEAYLRATTAPLGRVRVGLLPAARAGEILAAPRPALEAAAFRIGREIGELSIGPGTRSFLQMRTAALDRPRQLPLAVAAGPVRGGLRRHDLTITFATLTPEGIQLRYHGDARDGDRDLARALVTEITEDVAELTVTDDSGGTYRVPAAHVPGTICGHSSASGETRWIPAGELLAVPVRGEASPRSGGPPSGGSSSRRSRAARSAQFLVARGGADRYVGAALADPGGVLPGPARATGPRLAGRLLGDRHGATRHHGHHDRRGRRAGRRRRAAAGQRRAHRHRGPGAPGLAADPQRPAAGPAGPVGRHRAGERRGPGGPASARAGQRRCSRASRPARTWSASSCTGTPGSSRTAGR